MRRYYLGINENFPYPNRVVTIFNFRRMKFFPPKRVMMDVGLTELFDSLGYRDYPEWFHDRYVHIARNLQKKFGDNFFALIPDYPCRWRGLEFKDNVRRTIENIKRYRRYDDVKFVPVVQWDGKTVSSLTSALQEYSPILDDFDIIAVTGGKTAKYKELFGIALRMVRREYPLKWIHALGLGLIHRKYVDLDSFDSFDNSKMYYPGCLKTVWRYQGNRYPYIFAKDIEKLREAYGPLEE